MHIAGLRKTKSSAAAVARTAAPQTHTHSPYDDICFLDNLVC
jgi:hypothetical protein